jgi:hypothetical protein
LHNRSRKEDDRVATENIYLVAFGASLLLVHIFLGERLAAAIARWFTRMSSSKKHEAPARPQQQRSASTPPAEGSEFRQRGAA